MSHARQFFHKPLENIDAGDLLNFFKQKRDEGQHLEFKSGEVTMDKILKEICAFLNSEGGLLIVGAPRENSIPGLENERNSFGEPIVSNISDAATLSSRIQRGIVPAPEGIKVHQVLFNSGSVFLIDIEASTNPPHQLNGSGQYYMREKSMSRPALHREIEEMFLQKRQAHLDLQIELERPDDAVLVRIIISNKSQVAAEEPAFQLEIFPARDQNNRRFQALRVLKDSYLAQGQSWHQEFHVLTRDERFFLFCRYYSKGGIPKLKATFAEILNQKIELLQVFNSEVHDDFQSWYDKWSYLLNE